MAAAASAGPENPAPARGGAAHHLVLEGVEKRYGEVIALERLDLSVQQGEFLALLGPSGCGKTTTLRIIAGLIGATAGRVRIGAEDITDLPPYRRDFGLVFQNYALFPHMTVAQNVAFGLEMRGVRQAEARKRVSETLELVRLGTYGERRPRELSGGQQQRVALARALVIQPRILLLDEPLSNLDAKLREEMRAEIQDIQRRLGITTVFVTHDQVEALSMCDRVAVMQNGRLAQLGTPFEIYERPENPFVADFVGRTNRLLGTVQEPGRVQVGPLTLRAAQTPPAGVAAVVMVRPHRIHVQAEGGAPTEPGLNTARGRITRTSFVGDLIQYEVDVGPAVLQIERLTAAGPQPFVRGQDVVLAWSVADTLVFPST